MYLPILILILIIAFALILIVMVQNPKGGGLSSTFGGNANTIGGVQSTNNFLDKATWVLAISLFSLILLSKFTIEPNNGGNNPEDKVVEMNSELPDAVTTLVETAKPESTEKPTENTTTAPEKKPAE